MIAQGWDVQAWCMTCRIQLRVDLRVVAAFRGREFSLWNQSTPCRSAHCRGVAYFFARAPGMAAHEQLQTPPTTPGEPPPPAWIARRGP